MAENSTSTKEKILKATLEIINSEGISKVTVRKIAAMAGVNIAAVNYHFGSKERVIDEALGYLAGRFDVAFVQLRDENQVPEVRFFNFLKAFHETEILYPELFKRFIVRSMDHDSEETNILKVYASFIQQEWIELLLETVRVLRPNDDDAEISMRIMLMMSALIFPNLLTPHIRVPMGLEFENEQVRDRYLSLLVDSIYEK
ncbi:MAG: TetR/AcrR family transcriptional regulator [Anaerolineales bacterium]|nr:TetR/AcrR family transcriptional regulator [Anaerolineales bacterium]